MTDVITADLTVPVHRNIEQLDLDELRAYAYHIESLLLGTMRSVVGESLRAKQLGVGIDQLSETRKQDFKNYRAVTAIIAELRSKLGFAASKPDTALIAVVDGLVHQGEFSERVRKALGAEEGIGMVGMIERIEALVSKAS